MGAIVINDLGHFTLEEGNLLLHAARTINVGFGCVFLIEVVNLEVLGSVFIHLRRPIDVVVDVLMFLLESFVHIEFTCLNLLRTWRR